MLLNDALQGGGGGIMGAVGRLASKHGGKTGELGNMASLAGRFSTLGSSGGMISKFIPILLSTCRAKAATKPCSCCKKLCPANDRVERLAVGERSIRPLKISPIYIHDGIDILFVY
jgi:hypothetical protein